MKREKKVDAFFGSMAVVIMVLIALVAYTREANCEWCPNVPCFDSADCPGRCTCLIPSDTYEGECVSLGLSE